MYNIEQKRIAFIRFRNDIVDRLVRKFPTDIENTNHMVLGLFDEIGELDEAFASTDGLDRINIMEEHGDLIFYAIGYSILRQIPVEIRESNKTYTLRNILRTSSKLSCLSKKKLAYDKDYDREKEVALLQTLFDQLFNFYDMGVHFDAVDAMNRVYNKLNVRYKDGFTTEAANNRNLEAERVALETSSNVEDWNNMIRSGNELVEKPCGCTIADCECLIQEDHKNTYSEDSDDFAAKCRCGRVECICSDVPKPCIECKGTGRITTDTMLGKMISSCKVCHGSSR